MGIMDYFKMIVKEGQSAISGTTASGGDLQGRRMVSVAAGWIFPASC